jgi:hypothetical protein
LNVLLLPQEGDQHPFFTVAKPEVGWYEQLDLGSGDSPDETLLRIDTLVTY